MTRFILTFCLITLLSCNSNQSQTQELALATHQPEATLTCKKGPLEYSVFNEPDMNKELFAVKFYAIPKSQSVHQLIIDMRLKNGGHFVSPNATRDFSGKFTVIMDDTDAFDFEGDLIENPLTEEEIDLHPFVNGPINWVRKNTTYTQQIELNTTEAFEVKGYIQFTIEPACTLEKVPFIIKNNGDKLTFEFFGC